MFGEPAREQHRDEVPAPGRREPRVARDGGRDITGACETEDSADAKRGVDGRVSEVRECARRGTTPSQAVPRDHLVRERTVEELLDAASAELGTCRFNQTAFDEVAAERAKIAVKVARLAFAGKPSARGLAGKAATGTSCRGILITRNPDGTNEHSKEPHAGGQLRSADGEGPPSDRWRRPLADHCFATFGVGGADVGGDPVTGVLADASGSPPVTIGFASPRDDQYAWLLRFIWFAWLFIAVRACLLIVDLQVEKRPGAEDTMRNAPGRFTRPVHTEARPFKRHAPVA
jgi:hypothetical protein